MTDFEKIRENLVELRDRYTDDWTRITTELSAADSKELWEIHGPVLNTLTLTIEAIKDQINYITTYKTPV